MLLARREADTEGREGEELTPVFKEVAPDDAADILADLTEDLRAGILEGMADEESEVSDTDLLAAVGAVANAVEAQEARDIVFLQQVEVVLQHWWAGAPAKAAAVEVRRLVLLEDIAAGSGPPDCPPTQQEP